MSARTLSLALLSLLLAAGANAQGTVRVGDKSFPVTRVAGHPAVDANAVTSVGGRLQLDGAGATIVLNRDTLRFTSHSPFFTRNGKLLQMVAPAIRSADTFWLPLQFFKTWVPATQQPSRPLAQPPSSPAAQQPSSPAKRRLVVLDAGHGGRDPGKPGPNGLMEKTAALSIVKYLAGFLRERGYDVQLTRARDTLIALADRPHLANEWKANQPAAVFVSVHANSGAPGARGFETYFLSEARTDDERRVAEMENAVVKFEDKSTQKAPELDLIVSSLKNDFYQRASNDLAELIQQNLGSVHPGPNRGVKQAGFRVLVGALMPAVLVETAFISNSEEARLLGTSAFQQKIAYSLAAAIDKFFETHERFFAVPQ